MSFLRMFDDGWGHPFESFVEALEGVTAEEAAWQAPCYAGEEREEGWPPPGTIAWQVAHVAHCKRYYTKLIRERAKPGRPDADPRPPCADFAAERAELEAAHREQRDAIAAITDADLQDKVGNGMTLDEFLAMAIRHDIWHAAQIAVARRLFRTR